MMGNRLFFCFRQLSNLLFFLPIPLLGQLGCIEFANIESSPVQCNSFRNGTIEIKEVVGGTPPYYYSIDGSTYSTRPIFDLLWPGLYAVTVKDSVGCEWNAAVQVVEPPILQVPLATDKDTITSGESIHLRAEISPTGTLVRTINWRPPSLFGNPNQLEQQISLYESTTFSVEVVNNAGCTARDQRTVQVRKPNIYAPNIIDLSSNQDAYFTLFSDEFVKQINLLQVYNRYGGLLFERRDFQPNDPLLGWNGRHLGKQAPDGVYGWVAEIEYLNGQRQKSAGSVTVIH